MKLARYKQTSNEYIRDLPITALFLAPMILLVISIMFMPVLIAGRWSLYSTNYAQTVAFIGLDNYKAILGSSEGWTKILNSFVYVFSSLIIVIPLGVGVATLLNRKLPGRSLLRTLIIVPWVLSQTVTALLWKWLLNGNYGPIVYLLKNLTGKNVDFLNSPLAAKVTVILANVWNSFPIVLILTLAALQVIPHELYESGMVDGATGWKAFTKITIPMIVPTIATTIIMQSMEYFNMVTMIYVLTNGGPFGSTETLSVKGFKEGFEFWHIGTGSAYSMIIFLINMIFSFVYMKVLYKNHEA